MRDGDVSRFNGLGVLKAVNNVSEEIAFALVGSLASDQVEIDRQIAGFSSVLQIMVRSSHQLGATRYGLNYTKDMTLPSHRH